MYRIAVKRIIINDQCKQHAQAKAAKFWHTCSQYFTDSAVYPTVQIDGALSEIGLLWAAYSSLDSQSLTMAVKVSNHAITRQQRIDSKIYRIELEDIVTLQ